VYVSTQAEIPYRSSFDPAPTHLVILHLDGPVRVRRGHGRLSHARTVPPGGLFLHPAGRDLTVELGGDLHTVHAYLDQASLQEAADQDAPVRLAEEFGFPDPLVGRLLRMLDGAVRDWQPTGRTYLDHLSGLLAAHLARTHSVTGPREDAGPVSGLTPAQLATVRELMTDRLAEPIPLAELAAAIPLSISQFTRRFKASTGQTPHRFLIGLRVEQACWLLRTGVDPIAEIAVRCGFSHQEHLTRAMRARLGSTPAVVRRS
jgi:AraC family transcriptional regulator